MLLALVRHNRDNFLNFVRIMIWSLVEAPFWIAGALVEDISSRMALWGVALAIVSTGPLAAFWVPGLGAKRHPHLGRRGPSFLRAMRPVHHHRARRIDPGDRRRLRPDRLDRRGRSRRSPAPSSGRWRCGGSISTSAPNARRGSWRRTRIPAGWRGSLTPISTSRSSPGSSSPPRRTRWRWRIPKGMPERRRSRRCSAGRRSICSAT